MPRGMDSLCYTTIFRRMQKLDVDIAEHIITVRDKSNNLVMIARCHGPGSTTEASGYARNGR